jgi:tetratricopeptide (TPR) repeat protein
VDQKQEVDVKLVELGRSLADKTPFLPTEENKTAFVNSGEVSAEVKLPPNSVVLVTLGAEPTYDVQIGKRGERLHKAEEDAAQVVELVRVRQYQKAIDALKKLQEKYSDTYWREVALYGMVDLYEQELRNPEQAEATRRELLKLPIDDFFRLRILERLRVDLARRQDTAGVKAMAAEIGALERKLAAQRQVSVRRYTGQ